MYKITTDIDPKIFRGYDLRGLSGSQLSEDVYYTLGRAYATWLSQRRITECPVGYDCRLNSVEFAKAFRAGLNDGGINTYDLGLTLTQIVYFSNYYFKTKGSAMITASHNPKEYNGLKLATGYSETMLSEDVIAFKELTLSGNFIEPEKKGVDKKVDIYDDYEKHLLKHFHIKKKWRVVVDGCCSGSGLFYPRILRAAGCEVIEQNCKPDGNFPMGVPDPTEIEVLERLAKGVTENKADMGFAYDSDGDRMSAVDGEGNLLWMDTIVALFAQDTLATLPNSPIVFNTLCSRAVKETIEKNGGQPIMWLTGHSFIKEKVRSAMAPFGGELSGHIYFTDNYYGHDDAAYATLRLIEGLERANKNLTEAVAELPKYISSPEIKLGLSDDIKFELINTKITDDFKSAWPEAEFCNIDGIRADLTDRMAIVRASQNGPYVTVKFEAKTEAGYEEMKKILREMLEKYPDINWSEGVNTHALD